MLKDDHDSKTINEALKEGCRLTTLSYTQILWSPVYCWEQISWCHYQTVRASPLLQKYIYYIFQIVVNIWYFSIFSWT